MMPEQVEIEKENAVTDREPPDLTDDEIRVLSRLSSRLWDKYGKKDVERDWCVVTFRLVGDRLWGAKYDLELVKKSFLAEHGL